MKKNFILLLLLLFSVAALFSQQVKKDYRKLHYISEEEMNLPLNHKDFTPTPPPEGFIRNVAEFDQMQAVLIRYPFGIPMQLIKKMAEKTPVVTIVSSTYQQQTVLNQYISNGVDTSNCDFLIAPTNTYWARDYGPWFVFDGNNEAGVVDFPYNRPRPADDNIPVKVAEYLGINLFGMDVTHTGGNYMCDGMGKAASTDLVLDENYISEQEIKNRMQSYLGIDDYFILEDPLHEYIKHIDCWGKFLAPDKVLIGQVPESDWRYEDYEAAANFFATHNSSYGQPYKVYRVFTPGSPTDTPYTNSLILNKRVFVPTTGSQWDDEALAVYQEAMPGYEIIGIQYYDWMNTDALHCRTKGIADINQLYIWHVPVAGNIEPKRNYEISAELYNYSGQPVYQDSVFVIYKINQGDYDTLLMQQSSTDSKHYTASITGAMAGDTVWYYLFAADQSGHRATHPFIGRPDPHRFVVNYTGLLMNPDTITLEGWEAIEEGVEMKIINPTNEAITIENITQYGELGWLIYDNEYPQLPYTLASGDTLSFSVFYMDPVTRNPWYYDTMFINTTEQVYREIIKIDSFLTTLSGVDNIKPAEPTVFPNPFNENVSFQWEKPAGYSLSVFDITGKIIYREEGYGSSIRWIPAKTKGHFFIYQLKVNGKKTTGKLLKNY